MQTCEIEMNKRNFNKRFLWTSIGSSAIGILLSLLVIKPFMHMAGDPPWLRQAVILALLGVIVGIFALLLFMRLAARRRNSLKFQGAQWAAMGSGTVAQQRRQSSADSTGHPAKAATGQKRTSAQLSAQDLTCETRRCTSGLDLPRRASCSRRGPRPSCSSGGARRSRSA